MISILTCSYNRAGYLSGLYKSLMRQTCYDFEWIIIDDGSDDYTQELISKYRQRTNEFAIFYRKQENGGKHRAINEGVKQVSGEWIFLVDSDDELTDDAIDSISKWVLELEKESDAKKFAAVSGLRMTRNGKLLGEYPKLRNGQCYIDAKNNERRKYHLGGDKAEIYRASILKQYPFPVFENENFLSEGAVWNQIAVEGYKIRWYPKVIYFCDYLSDGLTNNEKKWINNFNGFTYYTKISMKAFKGIHKVRPMIKYIHYAKIKGLDRKEIKKNLSLPYYSYMIGAVANKIYCVIKSI